MINSASSLKWLWLTLIFLVVDQATKHYVANNMDLYQSIEVLPFFNITYVHNLGAAFSFLADQSGWQRWFFAGIATIASVVFTFWLYKTPASNKRLCAAFALLLSGALGNLIDRVMLGYVIDFLDFTIINYRWPAFNVADSVIFIGAGLMIIDSFGEQSAEQSSKNA
ncbi:signal peptidase II [Thalassotalea sp. LPB0316]|uniref:signal peptidase II n=1 Tax=Thalassotalea sp. LPB0316 TaxID=2769490 RepID=UPI001867256C|nr:signal peptidase II [Thalassotalea sp. LPB0316]QOL25778.1 signal peptidase II [Thalassotalea sp. LPB0316]